MLSNYINDKYYGGDDNEYSDNEYDGGLDAKTVSFFVIGLVLGLMAMVLFLYISRTMSKCSNHFISHLRSDYLEGNDFKETSFNQSQGIKRNNVHF